MSSPPHTNDTNVYATLLFLQKEIEKMKVKINKEYYHLHHLEQDLDRKLIDIEIMKDSYISDDEKEEESWDYNDIIWDKPVQKLPKPLHENNKSYKM